MDNFSKRYWEQWERFLQGTDKTFALYTLHYPCDLLDVESVTLRLLYFCPPENRGRGEGGIRNISTT